MLKAAEVEIKKEHQMLMVNKTTSFKKKGKGKITLPVTFGGELNYQTERVVFDVVELPLPYNETLYMKNMVLL